jgi:hypothetical protein
LKNDLLQERRAPRSEIPPLTVVSSERLSPSGRERVPPLNTERPSTRPAPEANGASTPAFLPVSIRDAGAAGQLEIELANACVVRLKGAVDPELLRIAIHAAGRLGGEQVGGD